MTTKTGRVVYKRKPHLWTLAQVQKMLVKLLDNDIENGDYLSWAEGVSSILLFFASYAVLRYQQNPYLIPYLFIGEIKTVVDALSSILPKENK